jgi:4-hydroxybenzoate polyprenyltransferase
VLAAAVLAYDGYLKRTPLGPLGMGACRFLNVLLGASTGPAAETTGGFEPAVWVAAAGISIYIVGVTWLARREAGASRPAALAGATGVMLLGVGVLWMAYRLHTATLASPRMEPWLFAVLLVLLMFSVVRRCATAMRQPTPQNVQAAVKHSILSLIWLDAATVAAAAGPVHGIAVAALLIPALVLGRWVYST